MSDLALGRAASHADPFRKRTVALMLLIGIAGFVGMLVLGAFAPDLRSGRNGGTHALSNAAVGFSGIVQLADATGRNAHIVRSEAQFDSEDLLVVTPDNGWEDLSSLLVRRRVKPTLLVSLKVKLVVALPSPCGEATKVRACSSAVSCAAPVAVSS